MKNQNDFYTLDRLHTGMDYVPWHFQRPDRTPPGVSLYDHVMDMQAWQYRNGLRIYCLHCLDKTQRGYGIVLRGRHDGKGCRCKLVDSRGQLTKLHDKIMFPHTRATNGCYRCLESKTARCVERKNTRPRACDLYISVLNPINKVTGGIDLSLWVECSRSWCQEGYFHPRGLESNSSKAGWRNCEHPAGFTPQPRFKGPIKWVKVDAISRLCNKFVPTILRRIVLLKKLRRQEEKPSLEGAFLLDIYLNNLYGIGALLNARQACRAWKRGILLTKLLEH